MRRAAPVGVGEFLGRRWCVPCDRPLRPAVDTTVSETGMDDRQSGVQTGQSGQESSKSEWLDWHAFSIAFHGGDHAKTHPSR
jgi:hypothetical protein